MRFYKPRSSLIQSLRTMTSRAKEKEKLDFSVDTIQSILPPLSNERHKGEAGRIGVIGGSKEYTGAPYFSAMAALRAGADIAHVFCPHDAGLAIKSYSPDLIVHPILDDPDFVEHFKFWMPRLHAIVIGPGLGRIEENLVMDVAFDEMLKLLKESNKPTIIDADGLALSSLSKHLKGFDNLIITPNKIEYNRFQEKFLCSGDDLATAYPELTVVRKGAKDVISKGEFYCELEGGSYCRCGGQGDVLSGTIAVFAHWAILAEEEHPTLAAGYSGSYITKMLNLKVFEEKGRSMVTNDFFDKFPQVLKAIEYSYG